MSARQVITLLLVGGAWLALQLDLGILPGPAGTAAPVGAPLRVAPGPPPGGPWPDGEIPYFNEAPRHAWALEQAVSAWNRSGASVRFLPVPRDEAKVIVRASAEQPCGHGEAPVGYAPTASVVSVFEAGAARGCDRFSAALVLAHELGHVLGLDHDDRACSLMNTAGNRRGPELCDATAPWTWRCRIVEPVDALAAVTLYGGTPMAPRSPAGCPLYRAIEPPAGLRLAPRRSTSTHLALAFRRPTDVELPRFLRHGGEPSFAYAYAQGKCGERPDAARYRWSVEPGQEQILHRPILGAGVHCFRVWAADPLGRLSSAPATLEVDVKR